MSEMAAVLCDDLYPLIVVADHEPPVRGQPSPPSPSRILLIIWARARRQLLNVSPPRPRIIRRLQTQRSSRVLGHWSPSKSSILSQALTRLIFSLCQRTSSTPSSWARCTCWRCQCTSGYTSYSPSLCQSHDWMMGRQFLYQKSL